MLKTPRSSCAASISPYVLASPMCCVANPASTQILQQPLRWTSSALMYRPTLHRSLARMRGRLQLRAPARSRTFMIHDNSKGLDRFIFVGQQTRAASVCESSFWQVLQTWSSWRPRPQTKPLAPVPLAYPLPPLIMAPISLGELAQPIHIDTCVYINMYCASSFDMYTFTHRPLRTIV